MKLHRLALKATQMLDAYDPYGFFRVNALQAVMMTIILLFVNLTFRIPGFSVAMNLPLFSLMIIGMYSGYKPRLKAVAIFCTAAIIYSILLSIVHEYRSLTVLSVGIMVSLAFALSKKKIPQLLGMIAVLQAATYTSLILPFGGDWFVITRSILTLGSVALFSIGLLALFPRVYFFRIWLRSFYLTLDEMEEKFGRINTPGYSSAQLLFKHLIRMHDFTDSLSYKEYGFAARRISLNLVRVYSGVVALVSNVIQIPSEDLQEIRHICHKLKQALVQNEPLHDISFKPTNNQYLQSLQQDFYKIIAVWNSLCCKI